MFGQFRNRKDAGVKLASHLAHLFDKVDLVLALPRGGVPVGFEVAAKLHIPLQVFVVRKLGVPGHPEYAMGAIASGGLPLINEEVVQQLGISRAAVESVVQLEKRELKRREEIYHAANFGTSLEGKSVILVDDGLATGSTMKAAVRSVRQQGARQIIVAVPVAPPSARFEFQSIADEFICLHEPDIFYAVGQWYKDFSQTTDEEVNALLHMEHVS